MTAPSHRSKQRPRTRSVGRRPLATEGRSRARRNATEDAILRAASRLFREKGYSGTSIAALAQAVKVRNASLYYYISSKQELLLRVLEDGMHGFLARLEEICATDLGNREKLRLALENHLDFIFQRPDAVAVFLRERRSLESPYSDRYRRNVDRYDSLFTGILEQGMRAGEFPRVNAKVTRLAILGMINWLTEWYRPRGELSRAQITAILLDLVLTRLLANGRRPAPGPWSP